MRIAGLVLAGGAATRMGGGDKALLPLRGSTILDTLLDRLRPQVRSLAISANGDPSRFAAWNLPVLPDGGPEGGPLAGLRAGLRWAAAGDADALLTVPGDTPFIPLDLAARLAPAPACAANQAGVHYLVALWPVAAREALACFASRRVAQFSGEIGCRQVWFTEAVDPFFNVNSPADLAAARRREGAGE